TRPVAARTCSRAGSAPGSAPPAAGRWYAGRAATAAGCVRWSGRVRVLTSRHLLLLPHQPQERLVEVVGAGGGLDRVGGVVGDDAPVPDQQQPVAPVRLVHDVAGDQQGGAGAGEVAEAVPQLVP